ncbi:ankyrin repeat-containing domain protein [Baffinella frigidus]|nr:ankyrin repeat-containing domain protein [Cryptophyta sp. CCMP2293]
MADYDLGTRMDSEEEGGSAEEKEESSDEEKENDPALLDAIRCREVDKASRLIKDGARFSTVGHADTMPLHLASRMGLSNIVEILLEERADVKAIDGYQSTPLHLACDALFDKADADKDAAKNRAALLRAGGVEEESDEEMEGEANGFEEVVGLLLRAGADTEARDRSENTPLLLAVEAGGVVVAPYVAGVIKQLLAANANANARSHKQNGALHLAARLGDATVVQMLLRAGANAAPERNKTQTPLHMDDEKVAVLLLHARADTAATDIDGRTALQLESRKP